MRLRECDSHQEIGQADETRKTSLRSGNHRCLGARSEPPQCPALRSRDTPLWGLGLLLLLCFCCQLWNSSHLQGSDVRGILSHTSLGGPSGTFITALYCYHCNIKHTELLGALAPACLRAHGPTGCCNAVGALVCLGLLAELRALLDTAVAAAAFLVPHLLLFFKKSHLPIWVFPFF